MKDYVRLLNDLVFASYCYSWSDEDGIKRDMFLICIKYRSMVIKMTDFDKYIGPASNSKYIYASDKDAVRRACNFLTYVLFKNHGKYKARRVTDIPFQAAIDYINEYAKNKLESGEYIGRQSVEKERSAICHFMKNLKEKRYDYKEHFYAKEVLVETKNINKSIIIKKRKPVWRYEITANYFGDSDKNLLRDIPQKALPIILRSIQQEEPELLLAVLFQLCAGIREGEVVNVRRANRVYPDGIRYTKENGKFTSFEIDLREEYVLRSDAKYVGEIKKRRIQSVYPIFLEVIQIAYQKHLKIINEKYLEAEAPLFVNSSINSSTGKKMAISNQSYCKKIIRIMREVALPEFLKSDDVQLKTFGMMLNEMNWGLHAFRHWFSVQLVLNGEDINGTAFWRGDTNLESAYLYLQNKGEIMHMYEKASEDFGNDIINTIKKEDYGL